MSKAPIEKCSKCGDSAQARWDSDPYGPQMWLFRCACGYQWYRAWNPEDCK